MKSENCKLHKHFSNLCMFVGKVQTHRKQENKISGVLLHHEYFVFSSQQPELREEEDFGPNNKFS